MNGPRTKKKQPQAQQDTSLDGTLKEREAEADHATPETDMKKPGHTWNQLKAIARDRDGWRNLVGGLCPWEG